MMTFGQDGVTSVTGSWEVVLMPGGKKPGPSIKRPAMYEALRRKGMSKTSAARISNSRKGK